MATTLTAPAPVASHSVVDGPSPRLWTREEYHRMAEVGIIPEGAGTELIGGQIFLKMGQNEPHVFALNYTARALRAVFGPDFDLLTQTPLKLGDEEEPEPDVFVFGGGLDEFEGRSQELASSVVLVVEVSDSTLAFDRRTKVALYAAHDVPEYWIVNLRERTLEVRRRPLGEGYAETLVLREGESVAVGSGSVAVSDLLPKASTERL